MTKLQKTSSKFSKRKTFAEPTHSSLAPTTDALAEETRL